MFDQSFRVANVQREPRSRRSAIRGVDDVINYTPGFSPPNLTSEAGAAKYPTLTQTPADLLQVLIQAAESVNSLSLSYWQH